MRTFAQLPGAGPIPLQTEAGRSFDVLPVAGCICGECRIDWADAHLANEWNIGFFTML